MEYNTKNCNNFLPLLTHSHTLEHSLTHTPNKTVPLTTGDQTFHQEADLSTKEETNQTKQRTEVTSNVWSHSRHGKQEAVAYWVRENERNAEVTQPRNY